uniref:Uncharacterized protein n=1 Tax=Megaselia scalaris TaxID=36166 RepID=T1GBW5_MEGSC
MSLALFAPYQCDRSWNSHFTPNRDELYRAMNHFGIPSKLINLSQIYLELCKSCRGSLRKVPVFKRIPPRRCAIV